MSERFVDFQEDAGDMIHVGCVDTKHNLRYGGAIEKNSPYLKEIMREAHKANANTKKLILAKDP